MKRQNKYPETSTFHFYNANPKNRITSDCVIRAICTAFNTKYEVVYEGLMKVSLKTGYHLADKKCFEKYLELNGWVKHKQPRKSDNTKYTGKEFAKRCRDYESYVISIGGHHLSVIVNGKINDIWDCSNKCVGNYWTKG